MSIQVRGGGPDPDPRNRYVSRKHQRLRCNFYQPWKTFTHRITSAAPPASTFPTGGGECALSSLILAPLISLTAS